MTAQEKPEKMTSAGSSSRVETPTPLYEYGLIREGKHTHLFARRKHGNGVWLNVGCLGGVPQGTYCAWRVTISNEVQRRFRSECTAYKYASKLVGDRIALYLLADVRTYLGDNEQ